MGILVNYREAYGMHLTNGILFNHESPRRGATFVTRKITIAVARISQGLDKCLYLGNIDSLRDWGHARDYVKGMWMMLQADTPDDFVLATGKQYTVRDFATRCFEYVGMPITWRGQGVNEEGVDENGVVRVQISEKYFRPCEVDTLLGDPTKAKDKLGWEADKDITGLIEDMMKSDLEAVKAGKDTSH